MREIKFRAWHDEHKEMVTFDNKKVSNDIYIACNILKLMADSSPFLMQYTGLSDKQGVDIYEGDELAIEIHDGLYSIYTVGWNNKKASFVLIEKSSYNEESFNDWLSTETFEVIGNIYQNKEFLGDN